MAISSIKVDVVKHIWGMTMLHGFERNQKASGVTSKRSGGEEVSVCGWEVLSSVMRLWEGAGLKNFAEMGVYIKQDILG